jgi:tetratricopeptide (TPR) repeat protein
LQTEHENVRAALRWAIGSDEGETAMRIVAATWRFWHLAGLLSEGRRWADTVLSLPSARGRTMARARALAAAGSLAYWQNDEPSVRRAYEEALSLGRELGDERAVAEGTYNLAFAHGLAPTHERSHELFLESQRRFESVDYQVGAANSLWALAMMARLSGDFETARAQAEESVQLLRDLGDLFGLIDALGELGRAAIELGDYEVARRSLLEALDPLEAVGYRTAIAIALDSLAELENRTGQPVRALHLAGAAEALKEAAGGQVPPEFAALSDLRRATRNSLSQDRITTAWEEGRKMSLQEAVAYARDSGA